MQAIHEPSYRAQTRSGGGYALARFQFAGACSFVYSQRLTTLGCSGSLVRKILSARVVLPQAREDANEKAGIGMTKRVADIHVAYEVEYAQDDVIPQPPTDCDDNGPVSRADSS
jgi:hypothetical protein